MSLAFYPQMVLELYSAGSKNKVSSTENIKWDSIHKSIFVYSAVSMVVLVAAASMFKSIENPSRTCRSSGILV